MKLKYWGAPRYDYAIKARSYRGVDLGYLKTGWEKVLLFSKPVLAKISIKKMEKDTANLEEQSKLPAFEIDKILENEDEKVLAYEDNDFFEYYAIRTFIISKTSKQSHHSCAG